MRAAGRAAFALAIVALALNACQPATPAPTRQPNAPIVERYPIAGGGEIVITVQPRYVVGQPIVVRVAVSAGTTAVRGPITGRVVSSGFAGERVIRTLALTSLDGTTVEPHATRDLSVTWDGKTDEGTVAPRDTYNMTLDFVVGETSVRVGTTLELAAS